MSVRYLTSDLHLDHANIVDYCDRPFADVEEMNRTLIENWNATVGTDDVVFFLGDLGRFADEKQLRGWLDRLNGNIVFIEGNHDRPSRYVNDLNTHQYYVLSQGDETFCLTHRPENAPRFWEGWIIHGHHHNNDTETYPLVNPMTRTANVSVELTGYEPIEVDRLLGFIATGKRIESLRRA